jgi:hypothetical protein
MIKIVTIISAFIIYLVLGIGQLFGQIKELKFPYAPGYELILEGNTVEYDQYNFPSKKTGSSIKYKFYAGEQKDTSIQRISMEIYSGGDTLKSDNTFLILNTQGMTWWMKDPTNKQLNEKHKTEAIKLPMEKGTTWPIYLGDVLSTAACITTDTLIDTPVGQLHAFGVRYNTILKDNKDYKVYSVTTEYYTQEIGKVMVISTTYIYLKGQKRNTRISEETVKVKSYRKY